MGIILANGKYAYGQFLPEGAIEVADRPRNEAEWESGAWTFPAGLAMSDLRQERNQLLSATDWWAGSDLTMTSAQTVYRTALRDLPSTASPTLDSDGLLTGVTWPTKPS
jgi:hypothetical protein